MAFMLRIGLQNHIRIGEVHGAIHGVRTLVLKGRLFLLSAIELLRAKSFSVIEFYRKSDISGVKSSNCDILKFGGSILMCGSTISYSTRPISCGRSHFSKQCFSSSLFFSRRLSKTLNKIWQSLGATLTLLTASTPPARNGAILAMPPVELARNRLWLRPYDKNWEKAFDRLHKFSSQKLVPRFSKTLQYWRLSMERVLVDKR